MSLYFQNIFSSFLAVLKDALGISVNPSHMTNIEDIDPDMPDAYRIVPLLIKEVQIHQRKIKILEEQLIKLYLHKIR